MNYNVTSINKTKGNKMTVINLTNCTIKATINAQIADLKIALEELYILLETFEKEAKEKEEADNILKDEAFLSACANAPSGQSIKG